MSDNIDRLKKIYNTDEVSVIGFGTYGYVYSISNKLCIKIFKEKNDSLINDKFLEIFFNKTIQHENIYTFHSTKYDNNFGYYLEGDLGYCDLDDYLNKNKFTTDTFFEILESIINPLMYLHSIGLIHSDITPPNILIIDNKFKLSDLSLLQYFDSFIEDDSEDVKDFKKSKIYDDKKYKPKFACDEFSYRNDYASCMLDVSMLGSTLLLCLLSDLIGKEKRYKYKYNIRLLKDGKKYIFQKFGLTKKTIVMYDVLESMLQKNLNDRIYLSDLERIITLVKIGTNDAYSNISNVIYSIKKYNITYYLYNKKFRIMNHMIYKNNIFLHNISNNYDVENKHMLYNKTDNLIYHLGKDLSYYYDIPHDISMYIVDNIINTPELTEYYGDYKLLDKSIKKIFDKKEKTNINYHYYGCNKCNYKL